MSLSKDALIEKGVEAFLKERKRKLKMEMLSILSLRGTLFSHCEPAKGRRSNLFNVKCGDLTPKEAEVTHLKGEKACRIILTWTKG